MAYTTIDNPELYHQSKLYAGDGNSTQAITLDGDEDMQPDLVWLKNRSDDVWNVWTDSVQGAGAANGLSTNSNEAAGGGNKASYGFLSAFGSDGFTVSEGSSNASMSNQSSKNYVAWCWKESADAGFDMLTFTGNETNRTISHSLSAVPHLMIVKNREAAEAWTLYHHKNTSAPETECLYMNLTDATRDSNLRWNDTLPTSSVFSVSTSTEVNDNSVGMITYLWRGVQGYSKFGSFVSNGNADGTFCYLGFRAAFILMKKSSASGTDWYIFYNKYPGYNENNKSVRANTDHDEEQASGYAMDILSNGFKIRTSNTAIGESGATYIYAAFAEQPFVNSNGVPCNAR